MIPEHSTAAVSSADSHDDTSSSSTVNILEDESVNENLQKNAKRKRRTPEGSENEERKTAKASCSSAGQEGSRHDLEEHVEAVTLFEVITMGRNAMQVVIDDWIETYAADRDSSLLDLISFFIQCSGCKGVVTAEMCQSKEDSGVMSQMIEELDKVAGMQYKKFLAFPWILTVTWPMDSDSAEYPLVQPPPHGRWFHSDFCDFVSVLVARCQHAVLFDQYLMASLISLLTELSNSYVRAFRHTCTLAALKLLSSLVGVALNLNAGIENSQKLFQVKRRERSRQQLQRTRKKIAELQEKQTEIESMMDVIFKGVFLKRYRDVLPEIRAVCMEELGSWMKLYSSVFLNDGHLKYLGWMMYDKESDVRLKCVLALQGLYENPLFLPKLDLFTSRFKDRMISMTLDKDGEVSVQAVKLLLIISKTSDDVLTTDDYGEVLQLVYSSHRPLAATAGELLFSRLLSAAASACDTRERLDEVEAHKRRAFAELKALLKFSQKSELHNHVVYLVDSLWDCGGSLLKDWPAFTSALLQEASSESTGFTEEEQAVLVEILSASVRQASEGSTLAGRIGPRRALSTREKKIQVDDSSKLTKHFLRTLPALLSKFSSSCDVVASLMRIPQFFLPQSPDAGNSKMLSSLMTEIEGVLDRRPALAVLEAAACTYLSLCRETAAWSSVAQPARDSLVQRWVEQLKDLMGDSPENEAFSADEEKTGKILTTLKKLRVFHNCHDLSGWSLFDLLSPLLPAESGQDGAPTEVLLEVLQCLCYSLLWTLSAGEETPTCREKAAVQQCQLHLFCERSHVCLAHGEQSVKQQAFVGVCDVLMAHSHQLQVRDSTFRELLRYTPSLHLQRELLSCACSQVFVGADSDGQSRVIDDSEVERLEELHRRRNLLAAFCKLIVHGVLEMSFASTVFTHYVKYYNDFGDIMKETWCRIRLMDKMESAKALVACLQQLFVRLKEEQASGGGGGGLVSGVQTFTSIKELARRFALSYGDLPKFRECMVMIHRNGIDFVFQDFSQACETATPPFLSYLTVLREFSCKLLQPDKKTVFSYLQKRTAQHAIDPRKERWLPLVYYRASLSAAADAAEYAASNVSSDRKPPLQRHNPEGVKFSSPSNQAELKVGDFPTPTFSPSHQQKSSEAGAASEPPAKRPRMEGSALGAGGEPDEDAEAEA
ncbi:unnamed protein product [Ophioblennius macclurei]